MSEEKKETKCCGSCKGARKELSNEDLDKVTGGSWHDDSYICSNKSCILRKTIDGVANVCTCSDRYKYTCRICGD